jgi:urease subunit beta
LIPGEYFLAENPIIANVGRRTLKISVRNTGDRPIQIGSHAHFFEINKALAFPRGRAYGYRLNIASGTSIRFEPGDTKEVEITEYGGKKIVYGFSGLVNGKLSTEKNKALKMAREKGFKE